MSVIAQRINKSFDDSEAEQVEEKVDRFKGVTLRKGISGFFVETEYARSRSYDTLDEIPQGVIDGIKTIGL